MIIGIGVDVCQIDRYAAAEDRRPGFSARWLTEAEVALPLSSRVARFAAKEALAKAQDAWASLEAPVAQANPFARVRVKM